MYHAEPIVLLVSRDVKHAQRITAALEQRSMPPPVHVPTGEVAVLWTAANDYDVCVIDHPLPDLDSLEALVRIHQRKPNVPVIILSNARSEELAIAAFRAGAADYLPRFDGYLQVLTRRILELASPGRSARLGIQDARDPAFAPTYQNLLRAIGRQLDLYGYRSITIAEIAGGFMVRALPATGRQPEGLEFPHRDLPVLVSAAIAARGEKGRPRRVSGLLATGYEDVLRALGHRLDGQQAEAVTITEFDEFIAVGGATRVETNGYPSVEPFHELLRRPEIEYILFEAAGRRASARSARASIQTAG